MRLHLSGGGLDSDTGVHPNLLSRWSARGARAQRRVSLPVAGLLALALALTGCADADDPAAGETAEATPSDPTPSEPASPSASTPDPADTEDSSTLDAKAGTEITTGSSQFGPMLFDAAGQAIYIWEVETSATPECYDSCATAWPPVLTDGAPVATGNVDESKLGTSQRRDGSVQVTYNDHPLYYYAHEGPGEVKCHNVSTHGGLWWVVTPAGDRGP